jgi:hypothetical protein
MPVLPIIDLLILMGWTSLFGAFALKAIAVTTSYSPSLFGMGPMDLAILAGILLLFALALSARTWVKAHESHAFSARERAAATLEAYSAVQAEARRMEGREESDAQAASSHAERRTAIGG